MAIEKNVLYGGVEGPPMDADAKSVGELVLKKLAEYEQETVLTDGNTGIKLSAVELRRRIIQCAKSLQLQFRIREGDVIGVSCENRLEFVVITFAALCLGATVAAFNVSYTVREIRHALDLARPRILFVSGITYDKVFDALTEHEGVEKLVTLDAPKQQELSAATILYSDFVRQIEIDDDFDFECTPITIGENVALILFSSGTTGLAKAVQLTQHNVLVAINQAYIQFESLRPVIGKSILLTIVPLSHVYGLLTTLAAVTVGAETVLLRKFEPHPFMNAIQTHRVNTMALVPPLVMFMAQSPLIDEYDLSSVVFVACGAAPLTKEMGDAFLARMPSVLFLGQGYGMTEMTLGALAQTLIRMKSGSVGILRQGVWGKIVDTETGDALGPHTRGELCFKGSIIMKGYVRNTEETKKIIDADGWLHTGDIGYYDDDEEWFIVDRLKELIKYKGFQVPPAEIENILMTHPDILDAAVIGIPDDRAGELPLAFVVKKPNSVLTEKDVGDFVAADVSVEKRLHGGVRFTNDIPRNVAGKILRRVLREKITQKSE